MTSTDASAGLALDVHEFPGYAVVEVCGEVDVYTCGRLRTQLSDLCDRGARSLIIAASGIEFIDSSGLGVLVGAFKRLRRLEGALAIADPSDRVAKMLQITGLSRVFLMADSVEEATAEVQRHNREPR